MKKLLGAVDGRRSKPRNAAAADGNILVSGSEDLFAANQLSNALKAAAAVAAKTNSEVNITLPSGEISIKGSFTLPDKISLKGSSEANTRLLLESSAEIICSGTNSISDLAFLPAKKRSANSAILTISKNSKVEISGCEFHLSDEVQSVTLGVLVNGEVVINNSQLTNCVVEVEKSGKISINKTSFSQVSKSKEPYCALFICSSEELRHSLVECEVDGFASAVLIDSSSLAEDKDNDVAVEIISCVFNGQKDCVTAKNSLVSVEKSSFRSLEGAGIVARGYKSTVQISDCSFRESNSGVIMAQEVKCKMTNVIFEQISEEAVRAVESSDVAVENLSVKNAKHAVVVTQGARLQIKKAEIDNVEKEAVLVDGRKSMLKFTDVKIDNVASRALVVSDEAGIDGANLNVLMKSSKGTAIEFRNTTSGCNLKDVKIKNGEIGVAANSCSNLMISGCDIADVSMMSMDLRDSSGTISTAYVHNETSKAQGICITFDKSKDERVLLQECKTKSCSNGARVEQVVNIQTRRASDLLKMQPEDDFQTFKIADLSDSGSASRSREKLSKVEMENCSFIMCDVGFNIDAAKATLKGCSFVMNNLHSIYMKNQSLSTQSNERRKASKLRIRWPNYVEPFIDNGSNLSNDPQMLASVTVEKGFCGSADFEPVMYLPTLTERIRQARSLFRSREAQSDHKAKVIMRSVSHMLVLLKSLRERFLNKQLLEDPELGMFAATFQLHEHEKKPNVANTLVSMNDLFESWTSLTRTRLFDAALSALNEAFERKQVDEELYDEWVTPLEEMQRVCFVNSKYNRRRDYLLETAKRNPLATWYFLDKEDPSTKEGLRLRDEVLRFLAKDDEEHRVHNKENFHASWVAQWAVNLLGDSFTSNKMPDGLYLRRAWGDKLLDEGKSKIVLDEYKKVGNAPSFNTDMDQLMKFEAFVLYEAQGHKLSQEEYQTLSNLLGGNGFPSAMKTAAKMFRGQGALPGFLRRVARKADSAESLLEALAHIHEDNTQTNRSLKQYTILAVIGHYFYPDSPEEPKTHRNRSKGYETCPSCLVQKLQPWNEIQLESCAHNHKFCRLCMKTSMSTGAVDLWGRCPGVNDGKPCTALATRKEMEMSGMEKDKIYNILNSRVEKKLQSIPGWKQCDAPGCIGGRSNVLKDFYTCRLCTKMVTMDNGKSDPTVSKKLLRGLDGTTVARGEGIMRECYHCSVIYEKGNACSTITCSHCNKQFSMTWGPDHISHRFDEEGIGPQRYVPKKIGKLWELGVFKTKKGKPLELGQKLTEPEALEVVRRAKVLVEKLDG